jgi:hypothetical protein
MWWVVVFGGGALVLLAVFMAVLRPPKLPRDLIYRFPGPGSLRHMGTGPMFAEPTPRRAPAADDVIIGTDLVPYEVRWNPDATCPFRGERVRDCRCQQCRNARRAHGYS